MVDRVGQQFGNYRLVRLLGQGGFADVYLAEHIHLETQAAVKVLGIRLTSEHVEHFRTEARTVARLIHPHIVRVLDFGVEDNTPYLAMDYALHGSLRQRYPKGTRLTLDTIVTYVKQVAQALHYAHEKKFIHRDIKPENMLLGENDQVLLSDFGIALVAQSTRYQNTQEVIGTAAYMAPEQLQGKPRRASDQYSLGIVVYEWLSGDRPFHGSFTEIYSQQMFAPPPPLHERIPTIPRDVEQVVFTALAKDPSQRFVNVQAFARALEQACQTEPPHPITLLSELPAPSQPLPPTETVVPFPSPQQSGSPNAATSSPPPPTKALSTTPLAESFSASNRPDYENAPGVPRTRRNAAIGNRHQGLHLRRIALLIGLVLLVLIGSLGLFNIMRTNQMTTHSAYATATAQSNAKNMAQTATLMAQITAAASATATARYFNYVQATRGTPVLDDPLIDNSKGNNWNVGGNACLFTGGAYHVKIGLKGYYEVCFAQPNFSNFAFQVQMTILKGYGGGMVFRAGGRDTFGYRFFLGQDFFNLWYGNKQLSFSTAVKANLNQTYLLTVIAHGSSISLYIDKQWVASVDDSSAILGGIGLMATDSTSEADVAFRNAKVWNL